MRVYLWDIVLVLAGLNVVLLLGVVVWLRKIYRKQEEHHERLLLLRFKTQEIINLFAK